VNITVTLKLRVSRGTFVSREELVAQLVPMLLDLSPIEAGLSEYEVAEVDVHPSRAEEVELTRALGPVLLVLEQVYLAGGFDADVASRTLVERLLCAGEPVMETELKRRCQVAGKWGRKGRPACDTRARGAADGDDAYAAHLLDWLGGVAA
jgi:hypothetical protein